MLTELRIENFAIIDHLELSFTDGFVTFTGDTGAGKSIIIDADGLLLSIAGTDLETVSGRYDQPILLDQFVPVQVDTTAQP